MNTIITDSQEGKRARWSTINLAIKKELSYNQNHLFHLQSIGIDNDAVACVSHMVKAHHNLGYLQHGTHLQYAALHAQTQEITILHQAQIWNSGGM